MRVPPTVEARGPEAPIVVAILAAMLRAVFCEACLFYLTRNPCGIGRIFGFGERETFLVRKVYILPLRLSICFLPLHPRTVVMGAFSSGGSSV